MEKGRGKMKGKERGGGGEGGGRMEGNWRKPSSNFSVERFLYQNE